ncbi:MAG: hypothetical protein AMXMBFR6_00200 [Betaproteobacteria bacterium]|nr:serine/threonine-protein phosphatase [Rhodocyclaceae bacterium]MCG3187012.1 hypothetical protein [Rhodocyclaceae bacterium]
MKFTIYQESKPGRRRANQDRVGYSYSRDALLMVVADGMGGHMHGEVAAQIAVQLVTEHFQREAKPRIDDPFRFLSQSLTNAHFAILDYARERALTDGPRTTCVACVVQDNVAFWAHAGDSRLYALRDGRVLAYTRDHSRVQQMIERGLIGEGDAANHPGRNRIFSCLGGTHPPQIDYSRKTPLRAGDVLCLCTDGVWGGLAAEDLVRGLWGVNILESAPKLMQTAEERGGASCDNLTMLALTWHDNYDEGQHAVSTQTLPLAAHTTVLEPFGTRGPSGIPDAVDFDETAIERAIAEINAAIGKFSG